MIKVRELLKDISKRLQSGDVPRASREAQLLLMAHFSVDELWLITNQSTEVEMSEELNSWVERRCKNEPFEYITNSVSFYSLDFFII